LNLSEVKSKTKVVIKSLNGGTQFKEQLLRLGIIPNQEVEVFLSYKNGPKIIKVKDSKIMIGYGMSKKIEVEEI